MPELPEDAYAITMVLVFPGIDSLDPLPYFPAHVAFLRHTENCERCHLAAFHRSEFPEDAEDDDLYCPEGLELRMDVKGKIVEQHQFAAQN